MLLFDRPDRQLAVLTLNRPERCNAFSPELLHALEESLETLRQDRSCRFVVLQGAGRHFCGGLDLALANESKEQLAEMSESVTRILTLLHELPQLVLAAVHGAARAGGAALVLCADLVVATDDFNLAFPEIHRGLEPALLFPILKRKIPIPILNEWVLTGLPVVADRLYQLGLVHRVVSPETKFQAAMDWIEQIRTAGTDALFTAKKMILTHESESVGASLKDEFPHAIERHLRSWNSEACQAGINDFLHKKNKDRIR